MLKNTKTNSYNTNGTHGLAKEINCSLLEKIRCLLSIARIDKLFWAEAIVNASHLINGLSLTVIGGKTPFDIWSGGASQDYDLLWVFESSAYFSAKDGKVNLRAKKFVFLGVKRNLKGNKLWEPENKIVLSKRVTFDETLLLKSTISQ